MHITNLELKTKRKKEKKIIIIREKSHKWSEETKISTKLKGISKGVF